MPPSSYVIRQQCLQELLGCPVCLSIPRSSPIFQCERGHIICGACQPKCIFCPVCRMSLITKGRSILAESLIDELRLCICQNESYGCKAEGMTLSQLKNHEENLCPFKLISCSLGNCRAKVRINQFRHHLTARHSSVVMTYQASYRGYFYNMKSMGPLFFIVITLDDAVFFHNVTYVKDDGSTNLWVYIIGTKAEAEKYVYEIEVLGSEFAMAFRGPVIPIQKRTSEVIEDETCLKLSDSNKRIFSNGVNKKYILRIKVDRKTASTFPSLNAFSSVK